jgi:hypothetical protein
MTFSKPNPVDTKRMLDLWDAGNDTHDIAFILGVEHESVVYNALARLSGEVMPARDIRHGRRA